MRRKRNENIPDTKPRRASPPIGARLGASEKTRPGQRVSAALASPRVPLQTSRARARDPHARDVDEHGPPPRSRLRSPLSRLRVLRLRPRARRRHLRRVASPSSLPGERRRPRVARALLQARARSRAADPTAPRAADAERVDFHAAAAELGITPAEFAARGLEPELVPHNLTFERRDRRRLNELDGWMDARATWYGGPSGPGPDGMSIYTGSCGYGQALGNHFISAWYDDHFPPRAAPRERPPRRTAVRRPTKSRRLEPTPTLPPLSSLISPSPVLDARPSHTAGTPTAGTTGA